VVGRLVDVQQPDESLEVEPPPPLHLAPLGLLGVGNDGRDGRGRARVVRKGVRPGRGNRRRQFNVSVVRGLESSLKNEMIYDMTCKKK
jgi:hypothetical protein